MTNRALLLMVASCMASCGGGESDPDAAFLDGGSSDDAAADSGPERDGGPLGDGGDPCASLGCEACVARPECGWCAGGPPGCLAGSTGGPSASSCNGEGAWWYSSCPPPEPRDPLESPTVMRVDDGYEFLEGPQWVVARGVLLFSDIPATTIHELTPPSAITPYDAASGGSNGLAIDLEGRVLRAEHGGRRIARERADGTWETLADRLGGQRLNSPNDLVVARDGTIYFTDPPYGLEGRPAELDFMGVFRLEPDGTLVAEKRLALDRRPNGIVLSPDESILYVADTARGRIDRYAVLAGGVLGDAIDPPYAVRSPDGLAIDQAGNLYAASGDGIVVLAPDGHEWGRISIPEHPANCAFGGADQRTLYVTARSGLYAVTGLAVAGVL